MAIVSTISARQNATIAGSTITLGAVDPNSQLFSAALLTSLQSDDTAVTTATGARTKVRVEALDNTTDNKWENLEVTYTLSGDTMNIDRRISTSNGGAAVTWSGPVIVYGIATHEEVKPGAATIYKMGAVDINDGIYNITIGNTVSTNYDASDDGTVTPSSSESTLRLETGGYVYIDKEAEANYGIILSVQYMNSSSVWTPFQTVYRLQSTSDGANTTRVECSFKPVSLTNANYNASGDWQFKIVQLKQYAGNSSQVQDQTCEFMEYRNA